MFKTATAAAAAAAAAAGKKKKKKVGKIPLADSRPNIEFLQKRQRQVSLNENPEADPVAAVEQEAKGKA